MESPPPTGTLKMLVMLVDWTAPDSVTTASATAQVFTDTKNWFTENSYSQLTLTGSVTNWMSIPAPSTPCNTDDIMNNARAAATTAGFTIANYDVTMAYFPSTSACHFAGLAQIGGSCNWNNGNMNRRTTTHETGHNLGLYHANSYPCLDSGGNQVTLDDPGQCSIVEYGNDFDAMGASSLSGHYGAYQKSSLGWLGGARVATLASGGSATLPPYENATAGTLVARINVSATRTYWIECRQATGMDSSLPAGAIDGVLVNMYDTTVNCGSLQGPLLLDMRPRPGTTTDFSNAALPFNTSWQSPDNWRITVGAQGPSGAPISVQLVSNDNFANNPIISGASATATGNNATATKEGGEPNHAGNAGGKSLWYRWTAPAAGTATIDTSGSAFNTLLGVYTGTAVNALTTIASNDDVGGGNTTSQVSFPTVGGTVYRVAVDGSGGASGNLNLHVASCTPRRPTTTLPARRPSAASPGRRRRY